MSMISLAMRWGGPYPMASMTSSITKYVYLGNSYDTPEFAAHAIAQWWADPERPRFQREDKLILCDAGGSNNCRSWLWKLASASSLTGSASVRVCQTGASKYNPIEYRLFSQIARGCALLT